MPSDDFSADNAIIMDNSDRWPLIIDPQMQAHTWIKTTYKERNMEIIKPTMDTTKMTNLLTRCVSNGIPVMLEDAGETFE